MSAHKTICVAEGKERVANWLKLLDALGQKRSVWINALLLLYVDSLDPDWKDVNYLPTGDPDLIKDYLSDQNPKESDEGNNNEQQERPKQRENVFDFSVRKNVIPKYQRIVDSKEGIVDVLNKMIRRGLQKGVLPNESYAYDYLSMGPEALTWIIEEAGIDTSPAKPPAATEPVAAEPVQTISSEEDSKAISQTTNEEPITEDEPKEDKPKGPMNPLISMIAFENPQCEL